MTIVAAAAVPASPGRRHHEPRGADGVDAASEAAIASVLAALPRPAVVVLLASGAEPLVHDTNLAVAATAGLPPREQPVRADETLIRAIVRRGQAPRTPTAALEGALGSLAVQVADHAPDTSLVPVTLPARAEPVTLDASAVGLAAAATATDRPVALIAAGDLATVPPADDAAARGWDEQAAAAFAASDERSFRSLGPAAAGAVHASGWAPLTVVLRAAAQAGLRVTRSVYGRSDGQGRLAAVLEPWR